MADVSLLFNVLVRDNSAGGLNSASSRMEKFRAATSVAAVGILGAATVMGKKAVEIASDTAESASKVQTLLGNSSRAAMDFAAESAKAYGIPKQEALAAVGNMAAVDRAMGTNKAEASKLAVEYTKLSADLGSFNNASSAEVQEALTASLSGEYEMLKKYGIVVNDTTLALEAQKIGMKKTGATWDSAQKRQLSYNIIMKSTKAAQGDFARTSGGLANQTKIASAQFSDLQGKLGALLLPTVVKVMGWFVKLGAWIENNQTKAKILGIAIAAVAGIIVTAAVAMRAWQAALVVARVATALHTAAMWALNAAFLANPIVGIVALIVGLIAVIVLIATKTDWFQRLWRAAWGAIQGAVSAVWGWIKSNWPKILMILTGPIGIAVGIIVRYWDTIKGAAAAAWGAIKAGVSALKDTIVGKFSAVVDFVTSIPGKIGDLGSLLYQKGVDLVQGFVNGIVDNAMKPVNAVKDIAANVASKATFGILDFGSPSRLMKKYGNWVAEGFAIGVKDRESLVAKSMESMTERISAAVEKMKAAVQKSRDIASGIRESFSSFADISGVETGSGFLGSIHAKADKAEAFAKGITALRKKGLSPAAIAQLVAAGPESGLAAVEQLMNNGGIGAVNADLARIRAAGAGLGLREATARTGIDPRTEGRAVIGSGRNRQVVDLKLSGDGTELTEAIVKALRKKVKASGGSVQVVLGTR